MCGPLKVLSSSFWALAEPELELLLPQPTANRTVRTLTRIAAASRNAPVRLAMQLPPQLSHLHWRECSIGSVRRSLLVLLAVAAFPIQCSRGAGAGPRSRWPRQHPKRPVRARAGGHPCPGAASRAGARGESPRGAGRRHGRGRQAQAQAPPGDRLLGAGQAAADRCHHAGGLPAGQRRLRPRARDREAAARHPPDRARRCHGDRAPDRRQRTADALAAAGVVRDPRRQRPWWTTGPLLSSDQRVEFAGSQLVWEYYPGQGIQLQVLGSFGKADGLYTGGPNDYPALEQLLSELIPLAAQRGGGLTWEYYFNFDGGRAPWTSAMSQATGLEALSRAYQATANPYYLQRRRPGAAGIHLPRRRPGWRSIRRSARGTCSTRSHRKTSIINAFLQTLIGLYSYAKVSGNTEAQQAVCGRQRRGGSPRCRASTRAPGRCTSPGSRTTSATTSW